MTTSPAAGHGDDARARHAAEVLAATDRARRTARADSQGLAIPLLVLGVLLLVYGVLQRWYTAWTLDQARRYPNGWETPVWADLGLRSYWSVAGALGLAVVGVWFALRSRRVGVGDGGRTWTRAGLVLLFLAITLLGPFVFTPLVLLPILAPAVPFCLALLVVAWRRHDGALATWAVGIAVVTTLAHLGWFTNRAYDVAKQLGMTGEQMPTWLDEGFVGILLGLVVLAAGVRRRRADLADRAAARRGPGSGTVGG